MEDNVKIIGITGGIGSGKSTVSNFISEMGYKVINSDSKAKKLYIENTELKEKLKKEFGDNFYLPKGDINKEFIEKIVFGEDEKSITNLKKLNSLVHPLVIQDNIDEIDELVENGEKLIFVESALIFEINMQDAYDFIICVYTPKDVAIKRLIDRDNTSEEKILNRMKNQMSSEEKKKKADFVINNNSDFNALKNATEFIIEVIK